MSTSDDEDYINLRESKAELRALRKKRFSLQDDLIDAQVVLNKFSKKDNITIWRRRQSHVEALESRIKQLLLEQQLHVDGIDHIKLAFHMKKAKQTAAHQQPQQEMSQIMNLLYGADNIPPFLWRFLLTLKQLLIVTLVLLNRDNVLLILWSFFITISVGLFRGFST